MNDSSSQPASRAWICSLPTPQPVRIFGLAPEEYTRRALRLAGVARTDGGAEPCPEDAIQSGAVSVASPAGVVAFRADTLFDPRLVEALVRRPGVVLIDPATGRAVAAHAPAARLVECARWLQSDTPPGEATLGLTAVGPLDLTPSYAAALRSANPPYLYDLGAASPAEALSIENQIYADSYKGVTDLVTKWVWPLPARFVVKRCALAGIHPNTITLVSWVLVALALVLFARGWFGTGLVVAWVMTFLDTVDGKLARVTLQSSRVGHVLDHGLDLVHPPFWWWAWGVGLGFAPPTLAVATWICVVGYVVGRALEGAFLLLFKLEIHSWRPLDSRFRSITARRNPNLLLLSGATLAGRPDLGLVAVAAWTALCIGFHGWRFALAWSERREGHAIAPWYAPPTAAATGVLLLCAVMASAPVRAAAEPPPAAATSLAAAARSRLADAELAMEQWDLIARFDSGHIVLAQFVVTNLGFGDRNAALTGHVIAPDGTVRHFRSGKSDGEWKLSDDGLRLEIGKALLDQRTNETRLSVARKKLGLDLRFPATGVSARSGGALARDGYDLDLLQSATPIRGTLWLEGMPAAIPVRGSASFTHRSMRSLESQLVQRRIEIYASAGDTALYLLDALRPDGSREHWLVIRRDGETRVATPAVEITQAPGASAADAGFALPRELRFTSASAEGRVRFERDLLRYEPLADLPAPIRLAVSLAAQPRRSWSVATLELRLRDGDGITTLRGAGIGDVTFMNPVPTRTALQAGDAGQ